MCAHMRTLKRFCQLPGTECTCSSQSSQLVMMYVAYLYSLAIFTTYEKAQSNWVSIVLVSPLIGIFTFSSYHHVADHMTYVVSLVGTD